MCRLLIVASSKLERRFIAGIASAECDAVLEAADLEAAARVLRSKDTRPTMIAAVLKPGRQDTLILLQSLHDLRSSIPVLLFVVGEAKDLVLKARQLGASFFVHDVIPSSELELARLVTAERDAANMEASGEKDAHGGHDVAHQPAKTETEANRVSFANTRA
jgi:DNA-binding response OmpR family regulator